MSVDSMLILVEMHFPWKVASYRDLPKRALVEHLIDALNITD